MKKIITSLVLVGTLLSVSVAQARGGYYHGHGNDFGRVVGYTAAAALTVGAVSYMVNSSNNNAYNRGYNDSYRNQAAAREQAAYDYEMSRRYYQPQPVYYTQPVYYAPPVRQEVIYVERPVYYTPPVQRVYYNGYYP